MNPINLRNVGATAAGIMQTWADNSYLLNLNEKSDIYNLFPCKSLWDIAGTIAIIFVEEATKVGIWTRGYELCVFQIAKEIFKQEHQMVWECEETLSKDKVKIVIRMILAEYGDFD